MLRVAVVIALLSSAGLAHGQDSIACGALVAPQAMSAQPTVIAPVIAEFGAPRHQLGAPTGVLSEALGESLAVDQVLFRLQVERCGVVASVAPAPAPLSPPLAETGSAIGVDAPVATVVPAATDTAMPTATDPAAYKPRTEFDNTPWRFNMNQNGEQMTADAFAAWMESKGVRVAKGAAPKPVAAVPVSGVAVDGSIVVPAGEASAVTAPETAASEVTDASATPAEAPTTETAVPETTSPDASTSPVEAPTKAVEPDEGG
ncbi:hypothetical protein [Lysobacter sp. A378]